MWTLDVQDVFLGGQDTATVQLQEFDTGWPDLLSYTGEGPRASMGVVILGHSWVEGHQLALY